MIWNEEGNLSRLQNENLYFGNVELLQQNYVVIDD